MNFGLLSKIRISLVVTFISIFLIILHLSSLVSAQNKCYVGDNEVPCPDDNGIEDKSRENIESVKITKDIPPAIKEEWNGDLDVLPDTPNKYKQNDALFISIFIITLLLFAALLFFKTKIFSKTLLEYILPIKWYMDVAILIVITQYLIIGLPVPYFNKVIMLPFLNEYSVVLRLTQAVWALMVALSVWSLVKDHGFNFKQILVIGILYSLAIHGLKVSIRYFFYGRPFYYLADRFLYGSLLVMVIVIPLGILFVYLKKKKVKLNW